MKRHPLIYITFIINLFAGFLFAQTPSDTLADAGTLGEVVISGTLKEVSRSDSPIPVEVFRPEFFRRNPTPSLFESLQTVNGVRPQINCNVCNTGDIHINGMEGPYTMVLIDGMPIVSSLATVYGLSGIPSSLVERIEVVKGPASTLYGSEAVGGLINVITRDPGKAPHLQADMFSTSWQEHNLDLGMAFRRPKVRSLLGINYFHYQNPLDRNGDNFTDIALQQRISVFNKWSLGKKQAASAGLRYVSEDRWGGQMQWTPEWRGSDSVYGESIRTQRYEATGAWQLPVKEQLSLSASWNLHQQDSWYGLTPYKAAQMISFAQMTWHKSAGSHALTSGLALRHTRYDDNTPATLSGADAVLLPGIFVQDEWKIRPQHRLMAGLRYDQHSRHGPIWSPRLNYHWKYAGNGSLRLGAGNGFRVVNLFTEDHAALTGARTVVISGTLAPETSWNANLNWQHSFLFSKGFLSLDASLFYTWFTNKIVADYETNDAWILYENIDGYAISRGLSLNAEASFTFPLRARVGLTLMDVFEKDRLADGNLFKIRQLLTEQISGTFTLGYEFGKQLSLDYTGQVVGPMRLPLQENDFRPAYSRTYSIQNMQLTWKPGGFWELYGGVKNLLNFTPPAYSILRPFDPFNKQAGDPVTNPMGYTFDPSYVYAPNQGARVFLGIRVQGTVFREHSVLKP
ncbi:MAG: TonB-dependent receptor [Bacteroidetes bacterium]|nr:MAG: TonB-dependent receptor [Bacteroidota bacterium]